MTYLSAHTQFPGTIDIGDVHNTPNAQGTRILRYHVHINHTELDLHKELSAPDPSLLQQKVSATIAGWDSKYRAYLAREKEREQKLSVEGLAQAAAEQRQQLSNILHNTISNDQTVDLDKLRDRRPFIPKTTFDEPQPTWIPKSPPRPLEPRLRFWHYITGLSKTKQEEAKRQNEELHAVWLAAEEDAKRLHAEQLALWQARKSIFDQGIETQRAKHLQIQQSRNQRLEAIQQGLADKNPTHIADFSLIALTRSNLNKTADLAFKTEFALDARTLVVKCDLPPPDQLPTLKTSKLVAQTGEIRETHLSDRDKKALFENICYQVWLSCVSIIFSSDQRHNIDSILFNGYVDGIDRATGHSTNALIMSGVISRDRFNEIDLTRVDAKACFRKHNGVSAPSLAAISPVRPVLVFDKEDQRFIEPRHIASDLDESQNLAAMDWEDFEHLVRELFEREFAARGADVKITRSSSDGGVDAVIFDPDPLSGGKIVVQAKRYTRPVGVAAVRELYGTMLHEKASRGILITTANFGPDAQEFSVDKHITLMAGGHLLQLLQKHGYKAKIDIMEARRELNLRQK